MSQEEQVTQAESDSAFLAGFNEVRPSDDYTPEVKEVVAEEKVVEPEANPENAEQNPANEPSSFAGFSESEIKTLLGRVAKLDEFEQQLRKANGKIGELNGKLQEFETRKQQPTQEAPAVQFDNDELNRWAGDYPELVAISKAETAAAEARLDEKLKGLQAPDVQAIKDEIHRETQLELMDTLHEGWKETVTTEEFGLWLSAQPDEVRQTYSTTTRAKDLSSVLKGFEGWKKSTVDRSARNKQRLEAGLTPSGSPSRATHAPSDEDAFIAGFRNIRPN